MELCSICHKRMAVVFISKMENGKVSNEGLCLRCAKNLGIPQVKSMMDQMGLTEDDLDNMEQEVQGLIENMDDDTGAGDDEEDTSGKTPPIDFRRLFSQLPMMQMQKPQPQGEESSRSSNEESKNNSDKKTEKKNKRQYKFLDQYCINLTKKAKEGKLDRVIGRQKELQRLTQILLRRQKNNPCLIGEPGVGKTAIAEALANAIVDGKVPYRLKDKEVFLLDLTALVAGTQFRGQFESRMKGLIEEIRSLGNIILTIDEVHNIVGAGDAEGSMNAANILKPALSRGEIQVIGATTLTEYRKYIEKDAALERRFQPITVEEPSVADTVEILQGIKGYYEKHHSVQIPTELLYRTAVLSERYITDRFLPDKAIDLLDEAAAYVVLKSPVLEDYAKATTQLADAKAARIALEESMESDKEQDEEKKQAGYRTLADLKVQELQLAEQLDRLEPEKQAVKVTVADLAHVIEIWTGIPASSITEDEFSKIENLEQILKKRIIGQDYAVEAVARAMKRSRAGISYKRKPVSFLFAGPTGVGKTELVKTLAAALFQSPETLIRLDMSEFMEKHSVSKIIGAPPGYVGYDDAGQLTEKIRRKPYSVVLFDEIEKAHPDVLNILLQILDDGRVTDAQGRQVNFENTVVIMTTNAGSQGGNTVPGFYAEGDQSGREAKTEKALSQFLRPEFINRIDEIITFRSLDQQDFAKIASILLEELKTVLQEREIRLKYTDALCAYVAEKSFSVKYGARNMRRFIQKELEDPIAGALISHYGDPVIGIALDVKDNTVQFAYLTEGGNTF